MIPALSPFDLSLFNATTTAGSPDGSYTRQSRRSRLSPRSLLCWLKLHSFRTSSRRHSRLSRPGQSPTSLHSIHHPLYDHRRPVEGFTQDLPVGKGVRRSPWVYSADLGSVGFEPVPRRHSSLFLGRSPTYLQLIFHPLITAATAGSSMDPPFGTGVRRPRHGVYSAG